MNMEQTKTIMAPSELMTSEEIERVLSQNGYSIEQSISGYYYLINSEGNFVYGDSAYEDPYDRDSAVRAFYQYLYE